ALHPERGSRVVGQNEHGGVEGRVVAPPAFPRLVGPRASLGPELVAAHDLCADPLGPVAGEGIVDAGASVCFPLHLPEGPGGEEPLMQPGTGVPEGRLETLALTGPEAVERNREVVDANTGHARRLQLRQPLPSRAPAAPTCPAVDPVPGRRDIGHRSLVHDVAALTSMPR